MKKETLLKFITLDECVEDGNRHESPHFAFLWAEKFHFYQGKVREFSKGMSVATMHSIEYDLKVK